MKRRFLLALVLLMPLLPALGDEQLRVFPTGTPKDVRNARVVTLNDKDFFLKVPESKAAWETRRQQVREQILVANGLWPLPEKTPLQAVIHGKMDREDYTVEKVYFRSLPGHYVSGNLYRPKGRAGKLPGVLCPHGHWANGRFYDAGEKAGLEQIKQKAEERLEGARYPLQARCVQLARMGCVVFHYDMVGNADSQSIPHRQGFTDAEAELRLQNFMGLQTWNSIRALDFLLGLPDIDSARIGVTGASGGGTQTFMLCGVDDRPAAAFPAVMVSTAMQGGCTCENCSYLRVGTGNIELAGLFAPKPMAMSGANDWTIDIETKGLPELKALYKLYGAEDRVAAKCWPQFQHNYNQVAREMMYTWFNKHLGLGHPEPVKEQPFVPVLPKDLSVYNDSHPRPADSADAPRLRQILTEATEKQLATMRPVDAAAVDAWRKVGGTALRVMIGEELPDGSGVVAKETADKVERGDLIWRRYHVSRRGAGEAIPAVGLMRAKSFDGTVVVWIHPEGKASLFKDGQLVPEARRLVDARMAIFAPDVFQTGEAATGKLMPVDKGFAGYTFGYNRTLLANRVRDILTAVAMVKGHESTKKVHLVGWEGAGPWVALARPLCGTVVERTVADGHGFRFESVKTTTDDMMLPGALKYGGMPALASLAAPAELYLHNLPGADSEAWVRPTYKALGAPERLVTSAVKAPADKVLDWLLR